MEWQVYDFTAEDLIDQGEIGHGNYGTVNKMYHERSGTMMAVKVVTFKILYWDLELSHCPLNYVKAVVLEVSSRCLNASHMHVQEGDYQFHIVSEQSKHWVSTVTQMDHVPPQSTL